MKNIVETDRRQTVEDIRVCASISHGSCHSILRHDLNLKKTNGFYVPHELTQDQKDRRAEVCFDLINQSENDEEFLKKNSYW